MAIEDTWHRKPKPGEVDPPSCSHRGLIPSARHGRGLQWRTRYADLPSRATRTKGEAERIYLAMRTELAKPLVERLLVSELVDRWLATKRGLSPRGFRACLDASRHVREHWGEEVANDITRHDVEAWMAGLPYGSSLKGKILQCFSGAFKTAPMIENPCAGVRVRHEQRREARFLTVAELQDLAAATGEHWTPMVLFLGTTGARIGECVALNVGDVDLRRGRVRVWKSRDRKSTKGGRARDVPVPEPVLAMLDLERPRDAPLFTSERGKRVLVDNWRARVFTPAADEQGLDMTVHDLRHTAASLAIAAGADVKSVQQMLGHKTGQLTIDLYGHLFDRNLDDVAARMSAALRG